MSFIIRTKSVTLIISFLLVLSGCAKRTYFPMKLVPLNSETATYQKQQGPIEVKAKKLASPDIEYYFDYKERFKKEFPYHVVHISLTNTGDVPYVLLTNNITPKPLVYGKIIKRLGYKNFLTHFIHSIPVQLGVAAGIGVGTVGFYGGMFMAHGSDPGMGYLILGLSTAIIIGSCIGGLAYVAKTYAKSNNRYIKEDVREKTIIKSLTLQPHETIEKLLFWHPKEYSHSIDLLFMAKDDKSKMIPCTITLPNDADKMQVSRTVRH